MQAVLTSAAMRFEGDVLVCDGPAAIAEGRTAGWFYDEVSRIEGTRAKRPLSILIDIRGLPPSVFGERGIAYRRRGEWAARRVAVVGDSRFQEFVINFLMAATGHRGSRYFSDDASARAWLAEAPRAT